VLTYQFDTSIYVVCCHQRTTTRLIYKMQHCQTCHQTILIACQLKIIRVVLQLQHHRSVSRRIGCQHRCIRFLCCANWQTAASSKAAENGYANLMLASFVYILEEGVVRVSKQ